MQEHKLDNELSFKDYISVLKRHSNLFFWSIAPIVTIGVAIAFGLPTIYESNGTIIVEQQEISEDVISTTVNSLADERVSVTTQRVMTVERLGNVIDQYGLYPQTNGLRSKVAELKSNVAVEILESDVIRSPMGPARNNVVFSVTYGHPSPVVARDVAKELVDLYLNESRRARQDLASQATTFLQQQADRLKKEIEAKEAELARFKSENASAMPELGTFTVQMMDRTERDLDMTEREIRTLRERQSLLESQLSTISPYSIFYDEEGQAVLSPADRLRLLQREFIQLSARYSPDHPDVQKTKREIQALAQQTGLPGFSGGVMEAELVARQNELAAARDRYSPDHPDVVRLERIVISLESSMASDGSRSRRRAPVQQPDNPEYIRAQVELRGARTELRAALNRRTELQNKLADYEQRMQQAPEIEREFSILERGYDELVAQFADVEQKLRASEIAETVEAEGKGERFTLLERPNLPNLPASPNRPAIMLLAFLIAFVVGVGAVAVAEMSDNKVRGSKDVTALLEMPPLAMVPCILNDADLRSTRLRRFGTVAAVGVWAALTLFLVFRPAAVVTG